MRLFSLLFLMSLAISPLAHATKARLIALGEDKDGSYYIDDNRNIFINAAAINNFKDFATFEWGSSNANVNDADNTPKAEGGVIGTMGVFIFGAYLGRQDDRVRSLRSSFANNASVNVNGDTYAYPDNVVDFFLGGDAGVKWGMNVSYSSSRDESATEPVKQDLVSLNLGAITNQYEVFVKSLLKNNASEGDDNLEGKTSYKLGGSYNLNNWKLYGYYDTLAYNQTMIGTITSKKTDILELGAGNTYNLNDKSKLFFRGSYFSTTGQSPDTKKIPVVIGLEVFVTTWLTVRGSVSQAIFSEQKINGKTKTIANTTDVNVGASITWSNLSIDGLIGTGNNGSNAIATTSTEAGVLSVDSLMTRVSVMYKF